MNKVGERIVQPSALHPSGGAFMRRDLPPIVLARVRHGHGTNSGRAEFVVTTPEVRCRVRVGLLYVPGNLQAAAGRPLVDWFYFGAPAGVPFGSTALWLAKRDEPAMQSAESLPVENIVGNYDAYQPIPQRGCLGATFEAETCSDELWGRLYVDATSLGVLESQDGTSVGTWILRVSAVSYQTMSEAEWQRVIGKFAARAISTCDVVGERAG